MSDGEKSKKTIEPHPAGKAFSEVNTNIAAKGLINIVSVWDQLSEEDKNYLISLIRVYAKGTDQLNNPS